MYCCYPRTLRSKNNAKYTYSSSSSLSSRSTCSSPVSDDTTVSFEGDSRSPFPVHRLTRTRARLKNKRGINRSLFKSSAAASSSAKPREQKTGKQDNTNPLNTSEGEAMKVEAMEVEAKPHKKVKKERANQPASRDDRVGCHPDSDYFVTAEDDTVSAAQRNASFKPNKGRTKTDLFVGANDVDSNIIAANIDIFTSADQRMASGKDTEPANTVHDFRNTSASVLSRNPSDSSFSSVYSNMPQLVDDLQDTFSRESTALNNEKGKKSSEKHDRRMHVRSSSNECSFDRSSSTEPVFDHENKIHMKLRKKPQVLVSKLNLEEIHHKKSVPSSPPPLINPTICVTQVDDELMQKESILKTSASTRMSPSPRKGNRTTPERQLRSAKLHSASKRETSSKKNRDRSKSPKPDKSKDEKHSKEIERSPRKVIKKENTENVLISHHIKPPIDEVTVEIENDISSCLSLPEPSSNVVNKEVSVTPHAISPVKKTPVKAKRPISQSRQNSDSDFDETPQKKKRRKIMERCSSEDEERPIVTPSSLTVRVSRKAASLQLCSEEPEAEDTSTLMDWESWEQKKKKASSYDASKFGKMSNATVAKEDTKSAVKDASNGTNAIKNAQNVVEEANDKAREAIDNNSVSKETSDNNSVSKEEASDSDDNVDSDNYGNNDPMETQDSNALSPIVAKEVSNKEESTNSSCTSRQASPEEPDLIPFSNSPSGSAEYTVTFEGVKPDDEEVGSEQEEFPTEISCTACGISIHWASQHVHNHPRLEVLICQVSILVSLK